MPRLESFIDEAKIKARVAELGTQITNDYGNQLDRPLLVLCVLRGAFIFCADLVREMQLPVEIDFIQLRSYEGKESSGEVKMTQAPRSSAKNRDILIIEDIVDTGRSMTWLLEHLKDESAKSCKIACLLDKPSRRVKEISADYVGFEIEDKFVVGYGLDFDESYRDLKDVQILVND